MQQLVPYVISLNQLAGPRNPCSLVSMDRSRFKGTRCLASNWMELGKPRGFGRSSGGWVAHGRPKRVFVRPLAANAGTASSGLEPESWGAAKACPEPLSEARLRSLYSFLREVAEYRSARGIRRRLASSGDCGGRQTLRRPRGDGHGRVRRQDHALGASGNSCDRLRRISCRRQGAVTRRGGFQTRPYIGCPVPAAQTPRSRPPDMAQALAEHAVKRNGTMARHQPVPAPVFLPAPAPPRRDRAQINGTILGRQRHHDRHTATSPHRKRNRPLRDHFTLTRARTKKLVLPQRQVGASQPTGRRRPGPLLRGRSRAPKRRGPRADCLPQRRRRDLGRPSPHRRPRRRRTHPDPPRPAQLSENRPADHPLPRTLRSTRQAQPSGASPRHPPG